MLEDVKNVILVLSGKGGVGKSTVSTQLALALKARNLKVGLLDLDLCGPSIPYLLQLEAKDVHQSEAGWVPVYTDSDLSLAVMSIGFLLNNRNNAVVWRGPKKTAMVRQFLADVCWGKLDYLIIDTPPGTSDEHITVVESVKDLENKSAVIVTTPQEVSTDDVRKELTFCQKTGIPVAGIVENMSGFVCPHCTECTNIFSRDGGKLLADMLKLKFLGAVPIDPKVGALLGKSVVQEHPDSPSAKAYTQIVDSIIENKT